MESYTKRLAPVLALVSACAVSAALVACSGGESDDVQGAEGAVKKTQTPPKDPDLREYDLAPEGSAKLKKDFDKKPGVLVAWGENYSDSDSIAARKPLVGLDILAEAFLMPGGSSPAKNFLIEGKLKSLVEASKSANQATAPLEPGTYCAHIETKIKKVYKVGNCEGADFDDLMEIKITTPESLQGKLKNGYKKSILKDNESLTAEESLKGIPIRPDPIPTGLKVAFTYEADTSSPTWSLVSGDVRKITKDTIFVNTGKADEAVPRDSITTAKLLLP
jgi:hypothetical protein